MSGSEQQFGDLDRVESCTLAQVVIADEQHEPATVVDGDVLPDAADIARVLTSRLERGRYVGQNDTRRCAQHLERPLDADRASELGVDAEAVTGEHRHAY